jgi:hypothetical protein
MASHTRFLTVPALLAAGITAKGKAPEVSLSDAKTATNASYDAARNSGVSYDPVALAQRAAAVKAVLNKKGVSAASAPSAHDTLDSFINNTSPMSLTDLEEQRQLVGDGVTSGKEGLAARAVKGVIDDTMRDPQNAVSGADPAKAYATLQRARAQALASKRLKDVETLQDNAEVTHNVHGTDLNKALKMQFGSPPLNNPALRRAVFIALS